MKKSFLLIVCLPLFFSCERPADSNESQAGNILENLSFTVDTVVVDPGEELINLSMGLYMSDVSPDSKTIYQFAPNEHSVSVIDLDKLKLVRKIPFEKEGPNGIGTYISGLKVLPKEQFLFSTFQSAGIFDTNSTKLEDITLEANDHPELEVEEGQDLNFEITPTADGQYIYSLPGNFMEGSRELAVIDRSTNSGKMIDIPALDKTGEFSIIFFSDGMAEISMEEYFLDEYQGYLYLSSSVTSDLYRYDFQSDSLELYSFPISISPREKTEFPKKEVSSKEEARGEREKVNSQIAFKNLMWDESRKLFFRIGSITKPNDAPDAPAKISVFLYAFDSEMHLIGETLIDDLKSIPESAFFKDGKLYSYVNVEDELGFAVFTFNF